MSKELLQPYPLFKGATRIPTVMGVPMIPLLVMTIFVASITMLLGLWWWLISPLLWFIMAQVVKNDDRAFRIWGLWIETKWRNGYSSPWKASTYSKANYKKHSRW